MSGVKEIRGRRALIMGFLLATAGAVTAQPALAQGGSAATTGQVEFDIPAQAVTEALIQFGRQSGMKVSADATLVAGVASPGVSGAMAPTRALSILLSGTGLSFRISGNTVTIERAPQSADGTVQLGPVRVEKNEAIGRSWVRVPSDPAATEGTGSFTTRSMNMATKLPLSIRETPQSVSVVTRERINSQNLDTIDEVLENSTGITTAQSTIGGKYYNSRGFRIGKLQYDGVALDRTGYSTGNSFTGGTAIYDRVEILRGASGLLQGVGTPGGAINLVRKRPQAERRITTVAKAGSWETFGAQFDIGGPIDASEALRARLVADIDDRDAFIDHVDSTRKTFYAAIDYDVASDTTIGLGASYEDLRSTPFFYGLMRYSDGADLELPRSTFLGADWNRWKGIQRSVYASLDHAFDQDWKFKLSAAYVHETNRLKYSIGILPVDAATMTGPIRQTYLLDYRNKHFGMDANLTGRLHLLGIDNELVLGASMTQLKSDDLALGQNSPDPIDVFSPNAKTPEPSLADLLADNNYHQDSGFNNSEYGIYGVVRSHLTSDLTLTLGGRVGWYDYEFLSYSYVWQEASAETSKAKRRFTPYAGLVYDFGDQWSAYASYADVFEPQTARDAGGSILPPVTGKNYEIGIKGSLRDDTLNVTLALFRIDRRNLAITDYESPQNCNFWYCSLASGKVRSEGFEAEVSGELLPDLQIFAGYTYNKTKNVVSESNQGQPVNTRTPKHMFRFWADYVLPGTLSDWSLGGGVNYQSSNYEERMGIRGVQPAYAIWNARIGYRITGNVSASINLNNIFDKKYYSTIGNADTNNQYGEPRSFLITLRSGW